MDTATNTANATVDIARADMIELAAELRTKGNTRLADMMCNACTSQYAALHDQAIAWLASDSRIVAERKIHARRAAANTTPTVAHSVTVSFTYGGRAITETYDIDRACDICSAPASGMYISAVRLALMRNADVKLALDKRTKLIANAHAVCARLTALAPLSHRQVDCNWGAKARKALSALHLALNSNKHHTIAMAYDNALLVLDMPTSGFAKRAYAAVNAILRNMSAKGFTIDAAFARRAMRHTRHVMVKRYSRKPHIVPSWATANDAMTCSISPMPSATPDKRAMRWHPTRPTDAFIMPMPHARPALPIAPKANANTASAYDTIPDMQALHNAHTTSRATAKRNAIKRDIAIWRSSHMAAMHYITAAGGYADIKNMTYYIGHNPVRTLHIAPLLALCSCGKPALFHMGPSYLCPSCATK